MTRNVQILKIFKLPVFVKVPLNKERTIGADRWKCKLYSDGHILMQLKTGRSTRLRKRLGSCRDDSGNEYKVGEEWVGIDTEL